ncbi:MAG TPA: hypothetical protein ENN30_01335 [Candidatus Woesearchaeota archaeon]|nr:hypothetical protein [Candidatus Woesearchaeota archaeon]
MKTILNDVEAFGAHIEGIRNEIGSDGLEYRLVSEIPPQNERESGVVYSDDRLTLLMSEYVNLVRQNEGKRPFDTSIIAGYNLFEKSAEAIDGLANGGTGRYVNRDDLIEIYNLENIALLSEMSNEDFVGEKPNKSLEGFLNHENEHRIFNTKWDRVTGSYKLSVLQLVVDEGIAYGVAVLSDKERHAPNPPKGLYTPVVDYHALAELVIDEILKRDFPEKYRDILSMGLSDKEFYAKSIDFLEDKIGEDMFIVTYESEYKKQEERLETENEKHGEMINRNIVLVANAFVETVKQVGEDKARERFYQIYENGIERVKVGTIEDIQYVVDEFVALSECN